MQGDMNALIQKHLGLVYKQLHKFKLVQDPEAESIAYEALYNAIKNYDSSKGTAISTVATVYIYNALGSYVRSLNKQRQLIVISYNNLLCLDDSDEHEYLETLADDFDMEKDLVDKDVHRIAMETFDSILNTITNAKHKTIITIWRDSEFTAQTTDIAKQIGVSQSYVSQTLNNFKFRLRTKLEDVYYD